MAVRLLLAIVCLFVRGHDPRIIAALAAHESGNARTEERLWLDLAADGSSVGKRGLAVLMREQGRFDESLACGIDLDDPFEIALTSFAMEDWEGAAQNFARLLSDDPLTTYNLALALTELGHDTRGIFELVAARTPPADPTHFYSCAAIAELVGDVNQSGELYDLAQEIEGR